jgi:hypothetical protein
MLPPLELEQCFALGQCFEALLRGRDVANALISISIFLYYFYISPGSPVFLPSALQARKARKARFKRVKRVKCVKRAKRANLPPSAQMAEMA